MSRAPQPPAIPTHPNWNLDQIVSQLKQARRHWRQQQGRLADTGQRELPSRDVLQHIIQQLCGALFPLRLGPTDLHEESEDFYVGHTLDLALNTLLGQVRLELAYLGKQHKHPTHDTEPQAIEVVRAFGQALPRLRTQLDQDILAAYQGDPAAQSVDEVLLSYPGILAIIHHRLAHLLYRAGVPMLARLIAEIAHSQTGIDIHPGAQIGAGFFIDHGTGVVIGETAIIGERVRLYQAVTLGAKRFPALDNGELQKGLLRHPIVEDDVVIYAGATVLGRITIGKGSTIGGNVWLTRSVPPGSHISQASLQQAHGEDGPFNDNQTTAHTLENQY